MLLRRLLLLLLLLVANLNGDAFAETLVVRGGTGGGGAGRWGRASIEPDNGNVDGGTGIRNISKANPFSARTLHSRIELLASKLLAMLMIFGIVIIFRSLLYVNWTRNFRTGGIMVLPFLLSVDVVFVVVLLTMILVL